MVSGVGLMLAILPNEIPQKTPTTQKTTMPIKRIMKSELILFLQKNKKNYEIVNEQNELDKSNKNNSLVIWMIAWLRLQVNSYPPHLLKDLEKINKNYAQGCILRVFDFISAKQTF
jgi:hypothetical protein